MGTVGIRELKQNASAVVAAAQGEAITITDRGRAVAQLTALAESRLQQLLDAGRVRPARRRLADLAMPTALEVFVTVTDTSESVGEGEAATKLSAALAADRAAGRY